MFLKKLINRLTLMPTGPIDVQPNSVFFQPPVHVAQNVEKSLAITTVCLDHPITTEQRIHPPRDVQANTMLARCWDLQPFPFLRPSTTQSRMHCKTRFILKHDGFSGLKGLQFFLKPSGISVLRGSLLADTRSLLASFDTQDNASSAGLVEPSGLFQRIASNELPPSVHPTVHGSNQILSETSLSVPQEPVVSSVPSAKAFPLVVWASRTLNLLCLRRVSNGSGSFGSIPRPLLSILDVALLALREAQLSLYRPRRLVLHRRLPIIVFLWRLYALSSMWGFSYPYDNKNILHCHFI